MEDIEKEFLKEQIQRQEKLSSIGALSAGIAHEVQNPLNFVLNFSRLSSSLVNELTEITDANKDTLGPNIAEEIKEITDALNTNIGKIIEHGNRALDITRSILLQSRGLDEEFLPTDVKTMVHEYVWLSYHATRAEDHSFNVSITENYSEDMPQMMVVPQDLSRAVVNSLNNSFYAIREMSETCPPGYTPKVNIVTTFTMKCSNEGELVINITDNGIGMTQEVKDKVFDNFFTTKPAGKGTGLGMGIIRHIIEDVHHGHILLESTRYEGTSITFTIPVQIIR